MIVELSDELRHELNAIYRQLELKLAQMSVGLHHRIFECRANWLSGCYALDSEGKLICEDFPIPVIRVQGYCNVEIHPEGIHVVAKMKRNDAIGHTFAKLQKYEYHVFGTEEYSSGSCETDLAIGDLKANIMAACDKEVVFTFFLSSDIDGDEIYEFAKLLRREGFYY